MAFSAGPVNVISAPSAATGRTASGSRGVASAQNGPVDGLGTQSDLQNTTQFNYEGFSDWTRRQKKETYEPLTNIAGKFETLSSIFVNMLDTKKDTQSPVDPQVKGSPLHPNFVAMAIGAYEDTALVINGNPNAIGQTVSLSL